MANSFKDHPNAGMQFPCVMARDAQNGNLVISTSSEFILHHVDHLPGHSDKKWVTVINEEMQTFVTEGRALICSSIHGITFGTDLASLVRDFWKDDASDAQIAELAVKLLETSHVRLSAECSILVVWPHEWASLKVYTEDEQLPELWFGEEV